MKIDEQARDAFCMLPSQHFRRDHQRALPAGSQRIRHHRHGHEGLARSHISFQQSRHRNVFLHVTEDLVDRDFLTVRRRELERSKECLDQFDIHRCLQTILRHSLPFFFAFQRFTLNAEHLLERDAVARLLNLFRTVREMQCANRLGA